MSATNDGVAAADVALQPVELPPHPELTLDAVPFSVQTPDDGTDAILPAPDAPPTADAPTAADAPTTADASASPVSPSSGAAEASTAALEPAISSGLIRLPNQHKRKRVGPESEPPPPSTDKIFVCECGAGFLMEQSLRIHWGRHCLFRPKSSGQPSKSHRKRQDIPVNIVPVTDVHRLTEIAAAAAQKPIPASSARLYGPKTKKSDASDEYIPSRSAKSKSKSSSSVPKFQTLTLPTVPPAAAATSAEAPDDEEF